MCICAFVCNHTDSQIGDEEVGDGAESLETIDDVDHQRITQNPQHDDGAVGQDQHHLQTTNTTQLSETVVCSSSSTAASWKLK